jgi:CBS domain-containing protein
MAKQVHGVRENDPLDVVETLMNNVRVRRVPVLDGNGRLNVATGPLGSHFRRDRRGPGPAQRCAPDGERVPRQAGSSSSLILSRIRDRVSAS